MITRGFRGKDGLADSPAFPPLKPRHREHRRGHLAQTQVLPPMVELTLPPPWQLPRFVGATKTAALSSSSRYRLSELSAELFGQSDPTQG